MSNYGVLCLHVSLKNNCDSVVLFLYIRIETVKPSLLKLTVAILSNFTIHRYIVQAAITEQIVGSQGGVITEVLM